VKPISKLKTSRFAFAVIIVPVLALALMALQRATTNASPAKVINEYIAALEQHDLKRCLDLSDSTVVQIDAIKANNPKALWPNLIQAYYDNSIRARQSTPGYFQSLNSFFPPGVAWKITETRNTPNGTVVYVTFDYPTLEQGPYWEGSILKQMIYQFTLNPKNGLVKDYGSVPSSFVFYPKGTPMVFRAFWQRIG